MCWKAALLQFQVSLSFNSREFTQRAKYQSHSDSLFFPKRSYWALVAGHHILLIVDLRRVQGRFSENWCSKDIGSRLAVSPYWISLRPVLKDSYDFGVRPNISETSYPQTLVTAELHPVPDRNKPVADTTSPHPTWAITQCPFQATLGLLPVAFIR